MEGTVAHIEALQLEGVTALYLIRHGATDWNIQGRMQGHADIPLNEEGFRQAQAVAERLARHDWSALWTSDLTRARQTAGVIASRTGLEPIVWDQLRERSLGVLEGKSFEEVRREYPSYLTGEVPLPGVESRLALRRRAMAAIEHIANREGPGKILVVTHGAFINAVLAHVSQGRVGTGKTRLENSSLNVLVWDGGRWQAPVINDIRHLEHLVADEAI